MFERKPTVLFLLLFAGFARVETARADNWPQWRGPEGNSICRETSLPVAWSENEHVVWKTPLPEWGTSSPAIWENSIFLTSENEGKLLLLKIDKRNGQVVWTRQVGKGEANRKQPKGENRAPKFHELHNLASPTATTDGERVIVHFGNGDLASYTYDGTLEWKHNLAEEHGRYTIWWGHANSPVFYENLVISVCMQDSLAGIAASLSPSYVIAHDKTTGDLVWKTPRMTVADAEQCDAYTSPIFTQVGGRTQMIVMGGNQLDSYDPRNGKQLWHLPGLVGGRTITGPTVGNDMVFATVGMRGPMHALRLTSGLAGDLSSSKEAVAWKHTDSTPDTCCPVVHDNLLFMVADNGVASCCEVETGKTLWKERLGGNFKATPLAAEGRIYFVSMSGTCTVVKAAARFEKLAENKLDDEFTASPAVSEGRIFLRGRKFLYTVGE